MTETTDTERESLDELESRLGYRFAKRELLEVALTHTSFVNETQGAHFDNERFEFLGDSVLGLAVSYQLITCYPEMSEGRLTKIKALIVSEPSLAGVSRDLELGRFLRLGRGENLTGGREKDSILSDGLEAVLGAVFLDGGFVAVAQVIARLFEARFESVPKAKRPSDFKSALQELVQARHKNVPRYITIAQTGPDHDKRFEVSVQIQGEVAAVGGGRSKKEAEQRAAEQALNDLRAQDPLPPEKN